jgi:hypothetical protein
MLRKSHIDAHGDVMLPKKKTMLSHDDQNRHQFKVVLSANNITAINMK